MRVYDANGRLVFVGETGAEGPAGPPLADGDYGDIVVSGSGTAIDLDAGVVTTAKVAAANKDGTAGTPSMRTLGSGAAQACAGNDARLSNARTPTAHGNSHKDGGTDELELGELAPPTNAVDFAQQEALQFVIENRTSDPGSPVSGQLWLRTDL